MGVLTGDLGPHVSRTIQAMGFSRIDLASIGAVQVVPSDNERVEVSAPERLIDRIEAVVEGDTLRLGFERNLRLIDVGKLDLVYKVYAKSLTGLSLSGAGRLECPKLEGPSLKVSIDGAGRAAVGTIEGQDLRFTVGGAGKIEIDSIRVQDCRMSIDGAGKVLVGRLRAANLATRIDGAGRVEPEELDCESLDARIDGAGSIRGRGTADRLNIDINGSGKVRLGDVRSRSAHVDIDGTGKVELTATESLDVTIDGFGKVAYHGRPALSVRRGGFGKVVSLDDQDDRSL